MLQNDIFTIIYREYSSFKEMSKNSIDYANKADQLVEIEKSLLANLNDAGKLLFNQFVNTDTELEEIAGAENFKCGFIIGAKLMLELLR